MFSKFFVEVLHLSSLVLQDCEQRGDLAVPYTHCLVPVFLFDFS